MEWTLFLMLPQIVVGVARVKQMLRQNKQRNDLCMCACSCSCFAVHTQLKSFSVVRCRGELCGCFTRENGKISYFMLFYGLLHIQTLTQTHILIQTTSYTLTSAITHSPAGRTHFKRRMVPHAVRWYSKRIRRSPEMRLTRRLKFSSTLRRDF